MRGARANRGQFLLRATASAALIALGVLVSCSDGGTNTLPSPPPGTGGGPPGGGSADSGSPASDAANSGGGNPGLDAGPQPGDPCDPSSNKCPQGTLCCPVGGGVREGGSTYACQNSAGSPPACP